VDNSQKHGRIFQNSYIKKDLILYVVIFVSVKYIKKKQLEFGIVDIRKNNEFV